MMGRHPSDIAPEPQSVSSRTSRDRFPDVRIVARSPQKAIWGTDAGLPAITADTTRKDDVRILIGPASAPVKLTRDSAALYLERLANAVAWLDNVEALHALQDETGGTSDG